MSTPEIPSKSPAADANLAAAFSLIFNKLLQRTDGMLPARVVSYNRQQNRATVQPLISIISTSGQRIGRAPIAAVPVLALGGGNFFVNFPLGPGDDGWIEASDRDISLYLQSAQMSPPNDSRIHSFEHGRFVPDVFDKFSFTPDAGAMVISSLDGSTRLVMSAGKITLIASDIEIQSTTLNITNSGVMTINTGTYNQNTTSGAGSTTTGKTTLPDNTTIGGTAWRGHNHHENGAGSNTNGVNP
jgi:hypothetical protein